MATAQNNEAISVEKKAAQEADSTQALQTQRKVELEKKRQAAKQAAQAAEQETAQAKSAAQTIDEQIEQEKEKLGEDEPKLNKEIKKKKFHFLLWALSFFGGLIWSLTIIGFFLGGEFLLFSVAPWQLFKWRRAKQEVEELQEKLKPIFDTISELEKQRAQIEQQAQQNRIRRALAARRRAAA